MRLIQLVAIFAALAIGSAAMAGPQGKYTLYFLDDAQNVCRIQLDVIGKPIGKPTKLTTACTCAAFSVSPDEKCVLGFTSDSGELDPDTGNYKKTWGFFFAAPPSKGVPAAHLLPGSLYAPPSVFWSPQQKYFMLRYGNTALKTDVYKSDGTGIVTASQMPATISPDERYIITEAKDSKKPSGTRVLDLKTGQSVRVCDRMASGVWIGDSHKLAWIDAGSVCASEITDDGSKLGCALVTRLGYGASNLRYVDGKGLYFLTVDQNSLQTAHYSLDGRAMTTAEVLPDPPDRWQAIAEVKQKKDVFPEDAAYSPDGKFIACAADLPKSKSTQVLVLDHAGHWWVVARGRAPQWKGPDSLWSPYQQAW